MQFILAQAKVHLTHKNDRIEAHGEEKILACDLGFQYETTNEVLEQFNPDLRGALYKRPDSPQGELTEDPKHMTALRLPEVGVLPIDGREKGELKLGTGGKKDMVLTDVTLTKFKLDCKEGGTVVVHFQAKAKPDEGQSGRLAGFLRDKHVIASFTPAEDPNRPLAGASASS